MKAVVLEDIGKLEYKEVTKPVAKENEVIVKIKACGVCGSDVPRSFTDGAHNMPLIIGHEFAGVVEQTGEDVDEHWINKRVAVFPLIPCKKCPPCQKKQYEMCKNYSYLGSRRDGGFAEYVAVPEWNLLELPDNISMDAAAMFEPMAVAVHAMRRVPVQKDSTVVICGLGTIGMLLTIFLLDKGVNNIFVIGNKEFQKNTAIRIGIPAENYYDSKKQSVHDFVMDKTEGLGADIFFECVGKNETINMAIDCTTTAGHVCMVGNPKSDMNLEKNIYWKILRNQITICGIWNSSYYGDGDDWRYVLDRLSADKINPAQLITHKMKLEDIADGIKIMRDKSEDYIKVMCYPNK